MPLGVVLKWVLGLFLASLILPALTKQWSDRQQVLNIEDSLITDVSRESVQAFTGAQRVPHLTQHPNAARRKVLSTWSLGEAKLDPRFAVYFGDTAAEEH